VGGADIKSGTRDREKIHEIIGSWTGVWYSHYGHRRLDGYTIGRWKDRAKYLVPPKAALFPGFDPDNPELLDLEGNPYPADIDGDDYFIFYDDSVYGQGEDGSGEGNGNWGFGYIGIVRAVNTFYDNNAGAVIVQYLHKCYPTWESDFTGSPILSFFGIYYRVLTPDVIQMANAVELANLYAGKKYYTETATLEEAVEKNSIENDSEFIAWGVVIPQDREP
jgi:hypothetical protein